MTDQPPYASTCSTTTRSSGGACGPCCSPCGDIEVVGESGSAVEATSRIPALRPDVAVLDGRLPDGKGIEVCRAIRSVDPSINALILTSYDDDEALFGADHGRGGRVRAQGGQRHDLSTPCVTSQPASP